MEFDEMPWKADVSEKRPELSMRKYLNGYEWTYVDEFMSHHVCQKLLTQKLSPMHNVLSHNDLT